MSNDKFRQMEDEMSRFEAEISVDPSAVFGGLSSMRAVIGSNTYNQVQQRLEQQPGPLMPPNLSFPLMNSYSNLPPPPPPMLIPHQLQRPKGSSIMQNMYDQPLQTLMQQQHEANNQYLQEQMYGEPMLAPTAAVVCSAPKLYAKPSVLKSRPIEIVKMKPTMMQQSKIDLNALQADISNKLKRLKSDNVISPAPTNPIAEMAISQAKASSALQSFSGDDRPRREKKNKKLIRTAGGQTWEDSSLQEWEDDDFRIFCGDLGNDVTDELLIRTFNKYPSFMKAKVIRDKRTNKSKGFGFVSFKDPADFIKAMKEMDGRYVGSRPIKLRKSSWKNRSMEVVRKKDKEKATLLNLLTSNSNR